MEIIPKVSCLDLCNFSETVVFLGLKRGVLRQVNLLSDGLFYRYTTY